MDAAITFFLQHGDKANVELYDHTNNSVPYLVMFVRERALSDIAIKFHGSPGDLCALGQRIIDAVAQWESDGIDEVKAAELAAVGE